MTVNIEPVSCFPSQAVKLRVDDCHLVLDASASFQWALLDANDVIVAGPGRKQLTGEDYANWGDSDTYPVQKVAEQLGVTIIED